MTNPTWHLITGEYPEQPGGVSDYSRLVARGLAAAGDDVHVWAPPFAGKTVHDTGVTVHRLPGHFDLRTLRILGATLNSWPRTGRLLVQYVPHAFGWKAMNIALALWLRRRRQPVWVMFHEVVFPWQHGQSIKHQVLGCVTHAMASLIAGAASRIFVSIPDWRLRLLRLANVSDRTTWLPIPSTLPTVIDAGAAQRRREHFQIPSESPLIGHFGTYGDPITSMLTPLVRELLIRQPTCHFLLLGHHSDRFAKEFPEHAARVHASGSLSALALSECHCACDVMLQPYPDGISTRRTSAMAALALGRPLVTTFGALSESLWNEGNAVAMAPVERPEEMVTLTDLLIANLDRRIELGKNARRLYMERFSLERIINVLRDTEPAIPFPSEG